MTKKGIESWFFILVGTVFFGLVIFALMKFILPPILPFIIAWMSAAIVRPPALWLSSKIHINERILRPILAVLIIILGIGAFALFIFYIGAFFRETMVDMLSGGGFYSIISRLLSSPSSLMGGLPAGVSEKLGECIAAAFLSLAEVAAGFVADIAVALPEFLISLLITIVATVYFAVDIDKINGFFISLFPERYRGRASELCEKTSAALMGYIRSYLLIMAITFFIMLVGLLIMRIRSAAVIAALIAAFDLLPLVGVGAVLLPWSIISFILGDASRGIGLAVLFVIYTVIRESLEPGIFAKGLNVHPIVTLVSIYLGYALFGFFGMIVFPVAAVVISGVIKKDKPAEIA